MINKNTIKNIMKNNINDKDTQVHILKALVQSGTPMMCSVIGRICNMSRERIYQNLIKMVDKGILLKEHIDNNIYYFPQPIFWNNDIIYGMYERMIPFIEEISKDIEYSQTSNNHTDIILDCILITLKLFSFEIEDIKDNL